MASDHKRTNTANKVPIVLPKNESAATAAANSSLSQDVSLQLAIGSRIRITTTPPSQSTFEGTVYTADPITNLIVLNTGPVAQTTSITSSSLAVPAGPYRILPVSQISSFQILSIPLSASNSSISSEDLPPITLDQAALQNRLARNIATQRAAQLRLGPKGTTPSDQALFDALSRTHPARWADNIMIISDTYLIEKPYTAANVKFVEGGHGDLERMRKVVDMERNKVALRMGKERIDGRMGSGEKDGKNAQIRKGG